MRQHSRIRLAVLISAASLGWSGAPLGCSQEVVLEASAGPIVLDSAVVRVPLASSGVGGGLARRLGSLPPEHRIYLVLRELHTDEQPGVLYHVYLDREAATPPGSDDPHYVGSFSFFDAGAEEGSPSRSFELTGLARNLQERRLLSDATTITIVAGGKAETRARPRIGRIELTEQ